MSRGASNLLRHFRRVFLWGLLCGGVFLLLTALATWLRTETHVLRYRLESAEGRAVQEQDAARATEALRTRAAALGELLRLTRWRVRPVAPDQVELSVRTAMAPAELTVALAWLTMTGRVEFRLLLDPHPLPEGTTARDLPDGYEIKVHRRERYALAKLGDTQTLTDAYAVRRAPVFVPRAFRKVELATAGPEKLAAVTLHFLPEDAEAFAALTALHAGRGMAMLVDGEMFLPPRRIESSVAGGVVRISGYFYMPRLRKLVALLSAGPLPTHLELASHEVAGRRAD